MSTTRRDDASYDTVTRSQRAGTRRWSLWMILVLILSLGLYGLQLSTLARSDVRKAVSRDVSDGLKGQSDHSRDNDAGGSRVTKGDKDDIDDEWKKLR